MDKKQSFQEIELSQLESVTGGGRIWNKIKHAVKKALDKIGDPEIGIEV